MNCSVRARAEADELLVAERSTFESSI